jgi:prefoldin subunit 5
VEEQEVKYKLKMIDREINSLKRKIAFLEKQKEELLASRR